MTGPVVEFRVPVSPTPEFALMLSVLSSSLRRFSRLVDPQLTVFIGAPASDQAASEALAEWMAPQMRPVIVDPAAFEAHSFHATAASRLTRPAEADVVILIDADVVFCGDLNEVCEQTAASPAICGVIAHVAPLVRTDWRRAFLEVGAEPRFPFRYTGWRYMNPGGTPKPGSKSKAPAYFNFGFVATTPKLLEQVGARYNTCLAAVNRLFPDLLFRSQVALTLAAAAAGAPVRPIPMRYNFPNDFRTEALYPEQLREARMIHLLQRAQGLDKQKLYRDLDALRTFVAEPWRWSGAAARVRDAVEHVLPEVEYKGVPDGLALPAWAW